MFRFCYLAPVPVHQHNLPGQTQVQTGTMSHQQAAGTPGTPLHNPGQFYSQPQASNVPERAPADTMAQTIGKYSRRDYSRVAQVNVLLRSGGNSSPVSPHLQQNGFNNTTGPVATTTNVAGQVASNQPAATMGQNFTGAGGTWTGSNTLTYTQSMQPPDNRNHHNSYCKFYF